MLIDRTIRNAIGKLEKKLLKEFCEIGQNVKIGSFCLILAYISVSRHDIGETKKSSGAISPRYMSINIEHTDKYNKKCIKPWVVHPFLIFSNKV